MAIDRSGQVGFRPAGAWISGSVGTFDQTLHRKAGVAAGDPNATAVFDPAAQWDGFPVDSLSGLGTHTVNGAADRVPALRQAPLSAMFIGLTGLCG